MSDQLIQELLSTLGVTTVYLGLLGLSIKWLAGTAIARWIDVRFDERMKTRMANAQFDLDQQMARIQSSLERDAERVRSTLSRETADFALWAERRHDATSELFSAFLKAEVAATNLSQFTFSPTERESEHYVASLLARCPGLAGRADEILAWHRDGKHARVDDIIEEEFVALRRTQVVEARNSAYEAYYKAALYLSDGVDAAARDVIDHFHTIIVPYVATARDSGEYFANKTKLRFLMLEFLNRARADLGRAARPPAVVSVVPALPAVGSE